MYWFAIIASHGTYKLFLSPVRDAYKREKEEAREFLEVFRSKIFLSVSKHRSGDLR